MESSHLPPSCASQLLTWAPVPYRTVPTVRRTLKRKLARRVKIKSKSRIRTGNSGRRNSLTAPQASESRRRR